MKGCVEGIVIRKGDAISCNVNLKFCYLKIGLHIYVISNYILHDTIYLILSIPIKYTLCIIIFNITYTGFAY